LKIKRKKALEFIQSYLLNSNGLTIRQLSLLLCQDMCITYRRAREDFVLPLKEHKVLVPITDLSLYFIINPSFLASKKPFKRIQQT
jgi:hypothetical protein